MKWSDKVTIHDWEEMRPDERENYVYFVLGVTKKELAEEVARFELENKRESPNTLFVSSDTLMKFPVRVKKIQLGSGAKRVTLTIIPVSEKDGFFALSLQDPWKWGNIFYS